MLFESEVRSTSTADNDYGRIRVRQKIRVRREYEYGEDTSTTSKSAKRAQSVAECRLEMLDLREAKQFGGSRDAIAMTCSTKARSTTPRPASRASMLDSYYCGKCSGAQRRQRSRQRIRHRWRRRQKRLELTISQSPTTAAKATAAKAAAARAVTQRSISERAALLRYVSGRQCRECALLIHPSCGAALTARRSTASHSSNALKSHGVSTRLRRPLRA